VGLAKSGASTYAKFGIKINCVAPGLTDTGIAEKITKNEAALKASTAMHPLGKIGQPDEVAAAIHFLLTQGHITGQVLAVDGGLGSLK
jgi:3-oxoacyl-[acyl-carrier protein] reductase